MTSIQFTPLRISTLVTTGHLGSQIELSKIFSQVSKIIIPIGCPTEGILKMEYENKVIGFSARDLLTKRRVSDKTFFNQSTFVLRKLRKDNGEFKEVNIKIFANGGFQMTGVTDEDFSREVIQWMINIFNALEIAVSREPLFVKIFNVQLLNSDYKMNALVKRTELHKILCGVYNLSSTFETTIYQGVNTKYYYNDVYPVGEGICRCSRFCTGQGDGTKLGACKRITIAVFQTGSIIITGARTQRQLDEAYGFINNIIQTHSKEVTRPAC
uniref:TATA-box binding protein n=1 Tax=viral metagenome TaxID=1070528 RepID=A0A6C0K3V7_9ZZZZ